MRGPLILSTAGHATVGLVMLVVAGLPHHPRSPATDEPEANSAEVKAEMIFVDPGSDPPNAAPNTPALPVEAVQPTSPATAERPPDPPMVVEPPPPVAPAAPAPPGPPPERTEVRLGDDPAVAGSTNEISAEDIPFGPDPTAYNIPPNYPLEAIRKRQEGLVNLLIEVAPDGTAADVQVRDSSGSRALDRAARDAVARWRFRPAVPGGPVAGGRTTIGVRFKLD